MNIEEYEFSDNEVHAEINEDGEVWLCAIAYSTLKKRDVIALAKHFKLDIALLNKLRDKFINGSLSCEHELLDMINNLELEK